jgi:hypothetical protein
MLGYLGVTGAMPDLRLAAEDRFAVVDMHAGNELFPHPDYFTNLAYAAEQLGRRWEFLWDFRDAKLYSDVVAAFPGGPEFSDHRVVLADPEDCLEVQGALGPHARVVAMEPRTLSLHPFSLDPFDDDSLEGVLDYTQVVAETVHAEGYGHAAYELGILDVEGQFDEYARALAEEGVHSALADFYQAQTNERAAILDQFLSGIAANSLLAELAIVVEARSVRVVPYHAHSLHQVETPKDDLVLVRPGRASERYWATFAEDLARLEALLNEPDVTEKQIERALVGNPLFLRGLNYQAVYPQVVLPRADEGALIPDVIAEPFGSEWAHIIDLKLAAHPVLVGRSNRAALASGIHSVVRQLREYAAYFDDRRLAQAVEDRYGFRCHRPRLVAIVGRDPSGYSPDQIQRAMTTYPDIDVVTYDHLLRAAKNLLLL